MGLGELSLAPSTRAKYERQIQFFRTIISSLQIEHTPVEKQVQAFMLWARDAGKSKSWVSGHLAAFSHKCKLAGLGDPAGAFLIKAALKGWARGETREPDDRAPITFNRLTAILDVLSGVTKSSFEQHLFTAAFCLAFYGAFRISELVAKGKFDKTGAALDLADVDLGDTLVIRWRRSKCDQAGLGTSRSFNPVADHKYCPVAVVRQYLRIRPPAPGIFLIHEDLSPLTRFQFGKILTSSLARAGLLGAGRRFSAHSFRIGAATEASQVGLDGDAIKNVGRWRSNCYKRYVRPTMV